MSYNLNQVLLEVYKSHPDGLAAKAFVDTYGIYCSNVDDMIDEEKFKNPECLLKLLAQAQDLYSSNFYIKYYDRLYPIIRTIHHTYADSVTWERSDIEWQKNVADVLRSCGNEMLLTVVELLGGYDARRSISLEIRKLSYELHHDKEGKSI